MAVISPLAERLLRKLLGDGEKSSVGRRTRAAALTKSNLSDYYTSTLPQKVAFDSSMRQATAAGAVRLSWGDGGETEGFIQRIDLADHQVLAKFLGVKLLADKVNTARENLAPWIDRFPVLWEVIDRWAQLRKVRTLGPDSYQDWLDAIHVIENTRDSKLIEAPIREMSGRLFKDTKRIEKLVAPLDVLLSDSLEAESRSLHGVMQEIGLFREEHPVRLAGRVIVERERVTEILDTPYIGLSAATVLRVVSTPRLVMTIENLTTFHSEAKNHCNEDVLLIYAAGMPTPLWRKMYARLLKSIPVGVPIFHWGDVDEGGFRIASTIAREALKVGHTVNPWKMHPDDVPEDRRRPAGTNTLIKMVRFAESAGWSSLGEAIAAAGFTVEQESLA